MKSTCIRHPVREPLLIVRQWQLDFCEGNHCAAALLSQFEYWHNIRLDLSEQARQANAAARKRGQPAPREESLLQFHTDEQLQAGLLDLYGTMKIRAARRLLVEKGAITEHPNPNPRYAFDKTLHFEFHPEVVNAWLDQRRDPPPAGHGDPPLPDQNAPSGDGGINNVTCAKNGERAAKNGERAAKNGGSYTEITCEISTETTTTTLPSSSTDERPAEPEAVERGGGDQDQTPEDRDGDHGVATLRTTEENPVSREEAQTAAATEESGDTTTANPKTVAGEEATDEQRPELAFPAKLTEREREDIAAQVCLLPLVIAQQMLDVVQSQIQGGQVRKNPAAVLRGIVRKYRTDPAAFDPSPGFRVAEARRRRAEAEARARAEVERRERERERETPRGISPEARAVARKSIASIKRILEMR